MMLSTGVCEKVYRVKSINLAPDSKRRFEILGLTQNSAVTILGKKKNGSMIIKIRGTRFAVGAAFADGIEVEPQTQKTTAQKKTEETKK